MPTNTYCRLIFSVFSLSLFSAIPANSATVSDVMNNAPASSWRETDPDNVLKITLPTGSAYVELNPELAPKHTDNIKKLAREGFYKDLSIYRFVEGFVAQGGEGENEKPIKSARKTLINEFYKTTKTPLAITRLEGADGYAEITGFLNGFAVAQNAQQTHTWQVHCAGVFAMARGNDINSGGTEFYVTIGSAQRYLDRNITVFGRVLEGMEHFNRLQRKPVVGTPFNPITNVQVLGDLQAPNRVQFQVMKTQSETFKQLIEARKNRSEPWFVHSANYIDVCAMPIPTRRKADTAKGG